PKAGRVIPPFAQVARIEWQSLNGQPIQYDNPTAPQGAEHASGILAVNGPNGQGTYWDLSGGLVRLTFEKEVPVGTQFTLRIEGERIPVFGTQRKGPVYTMTEATTKTVVLDLTGLFEAYDVTPAQVNRVIRIV